VLGYVDDAALPPLMTGAAALVYPSLYEGFGLPPLEAVACGTPALVSDLPAVREATAGSAVLLPVGDVDVWAEAMRMALGGAIVPGTPPSWTWDEAGRALVAVIGELNGASSG
jgi:alpha-1,3-rhamnosyl/mannosyltransferase